MSVPQDSEISVSVDHDRSAFGTIKGTDEKKEPVIGGTTPGGSVSGF
ncbi:MAG: hypothetical protein KDB53_00965 [Planctomycetes bacterium]|nr:hypothetical protein [Planctomycetota bacterium]